MPVETDPVSTGVKEVLVDALGVDEAEVTSKATLGPDLGAESIDFLDIIFRLEKKFNIQIQRGEIVALVPEVEARRRIQEFFHLSDQEVEDHIQNRDPHTEVATVQEIETFVRGKLQGATE